MKWITLTNEADTGNLKQHCFVSAIRGGRWFSPYIGNKALCSNLGAFDGNRYTHYDWLGREDINEDNCCKKCLRAYRKPTHTKIK
jgi:hypothetical protein